MPANEFSNSQVRAKRPAAWPSGRESSTRPAKLARAETRNKHLSSPKSTGLDPLLSRCSVAVSQAVVCGLRDRVCEEGERGNPSDRKCGGFREKNCYASGGLRRNHQLSHYSTPGFSVRHRSCCYRFVLNIASASGPRHVVVERMRSEGAAARAGGFVPFLAFRDSTGERDSTFHQPCTPSWPMSERNCGMGVYLSPTTPTPSQPTSSCTFHQL